MVLRLIRIRFDPSQTDNETNRQTADMLRRAADIVESGGSALISAPYLNDPFIDELSGTTTYIVPPGDIFKYV